MASAEGLLKHMTEMIQELRKTNEMQRQAMADQQALIQRMVDQQQTSSSSGSHGVIEMTKVGKPDLLKGGREETKRQWPDWAYVFKSWFSVSEHAEKALVWARQQDETTISEDDVKSVGIKDIDKIDRQLHSALVALCRDDSLKTIKNATNQSGLEAWRRLTRAYDPLDPQTNWSMLQSLTHDLRQFPLEDLMSSIESWEKRLKEYQERSGEGISNSSRILSLKSMCPPELQTHLDLNAKRFKTHELVKEEIESFVNASAKPRGGSDGASQLSYLGKGKNPKGKGKHGAKGKRTDNGNQGWQTSRLQDASSWQNQTSKCKRCHKALKGFHTEWDCWFNPKNMSKEAVEKKACESRRKGPSWWQER